MRVKNIYAQHTHTRERERGKNRNKKQANRAISISGYVGFQKLNYTRNTFM